MSDVSRDAILIRPATDADFSAIWKIFEPVVRAGDTYTYPADTTFKQAREIWFAPEKHVYVAELGGEVAGTYFIRANQGGGGAHVSNCGYMVRPDMGRHGIGRAMCEHSLDEARRLGFTAMQFNFVVATNTGAVALWQKMGFDIIGTLPGAFRHPQMGFVDAHVMYRML